MRNLKLKIKILVQLLDVLICFGFSLVALYLYTIFNLAKQGSGALVDIFHGRIHRIKFEYLDLRRQLRSHL